MAPARLRAQKSGKSDRKEKSRVYLQYGAAKPGEGKKWPLKRRLRFATGGKNMHDLPRNARLAPSKERKEGAETVALAIGHTCWRARLRIEPLFRKGVGGPGKRRIPGKNVMNWSRSNESSGPGQSVASSCSCPSLLKDLKHIDSPLLKKDVRSYAQFVYEHGDYGVYTGKDYHRSSILI